MTASAAGASPATTAHGRGDTEAGSDAGYGYGYGYGCREARRRGSRPEGRIAVSAPRRGADRGRHAVLLAAGPRARATGAGA